MFVFYVGESSGGGGGDWSSPATAQLSQQVAP